MPPRLWSRAPRPSDPLTGPVSAFESETQGVIQTRAPASEQAILHAILAMIALAIVLMCVVKVDRIVRGSGQIVAARGTLFVRPLDRAIVKAVLVRSGDVVRKGQPLATLDPTFAAADLTDLEEKQAAAEALAARLSAEQAGTPYTPEPGSGEASLQASVWRQRQVEYAQALRDFDARIEADRSTIARADKDRTAYAQRQALAQQAYAAETALQQRGFGSRLELIQAASQRVEAERQASASVNQEDEARHDLAALQAQKAVYIGKWRDDIASDLAKARNDLADVTQNIAKARKVRDLAVLAAPADAVVLNIGKASTGTVVDSNTTASEPLFTLTPLDGPLEAEIDVASRDVGFIRRGDSVRVKLDAFRFTAHGSAKGVIESISDGAFSQSDVGQPRPPYYRVRVRLTDVRLRNLPKDARLIPGMTLEGDVVIGSRTIMSYLLEGALRTGSEAMREP